MTPPLRRWVFLLALPLLLHGGPSMAQAGADRATAKTSVEAAPSLTCVDCHAEIKGTKARPAHHPGPCESCHAGGAAHIQAMLKAAPAKGSIAVPDSARCLACHASDKKLMNWHFGAHDQVEGGCRACHAIHSSPVNERPGLSYNRADRTSALCLGCHQEVRSQFNMASHHPVKEGGMSCISCHDPHGGRQTALKSSSEQCLTCHQAQRGPMVFEHAPVVEDCMNCHSPHGSTSRRLLTVSQPAACLQCHAIAQGKHGYGTGAEPTQTSGTRIISGAVLRSCTNCHSAIHGSQQDPVLRY